MMQVIEDSFMPLPEPICDGPAAQLYSAQQMTAYAKACYDKWSVLLAAPTQGADAQLADCGEMLPGEFDNAEDLIAALQGADARPVAMPNLDGDWSPISETLVHRLRDPIPAQALADMPERMAEAINVITEEAADAIESLCGQFRELEYIMECSKNAKSVAALNLNLESGLGDGGLLDANIEAARATPADHSRDSVIEEILPADRRWVVSGAIAKVAGYRNCNAPRTKEVMQEFVDYMNAALADARDTAIELCAKEADDWAGAYRIMASGDYTGASYHREGAAHEIADNIRTLKSQQDAAIESQRSEGESS